MTGVHSLDRLIGNEYPTFASEADVRAFVGGEGERVRFGDVACGALLGKPAVAPGGSDSAGFPAITIGTFGATARGAGNAMFLMERCARPETACRQELDDGRRTSIRDARTCLCQVFGPDRRKQRAGG